MHLLDMGVTIKNLVLLLSNKSNQKIQPFTKAKMSSSLVSPNQFVPVEFSRKPRSLDELGRWKSVEFSQKSYILAWFS